jgi:hypothetical protein
MLRRIFGPKRDEVASVGGKIYILRSFITFTLRKMNYQVKEDEMGRA